MAFKLSLCLALVLGCCVSLPASSQDNKDAGFNSYVEGALEVYALFKEPSKQESEQFYSYIKSKWEISDCKDNCSELGRSTGVEYANRMRIQLDNEVQ